MTFNFECTFLDFISKLRYLTRSESILTLISKRLQIKIGKVQEGKITSKDWRLFRQI